MYEIQRLLGPCWYSYIYYTFKVGVNLKARALIDFIIFMFLYAYSYSLISNYIFGDQEHYRKLYELFADTNFTSILLIGLGVIGSSEPVSLFILWLGCRTLYVFCLCWVYKSFPTQVLSSCVTQYFVMVAFVFKF